MQNLPLVDLPTRDVTDAVLGVLQRYASPTVAQSVLGVARQRARISGTQITREQLGDMLDAIERSLVFYVGDGNQAKRCRRELEALTMPASGPVSAPRLVTLRIRGEDDLVRARAEARSFAAAHGFTTVGQTRVMTAVSELARNIAQYAGEGQIDITPTTAPPGLEIVAKDRGPGIPNLDRIMAGDYRSRLGMGLGLRGVKKIAERFDVQTEAGRGTTVSALLKVC